MRLRFRHLAAVTTAMTFALILLGVYTGAVGAGLTCAGRWPFCDGFLGLFPANWLSFVEWFHRFVAMITGFFIIGTALVAWRTGRDRWIRYTTGIAVVMLPVQILLGANTIFNFGVWAQMAHHAAAQLIFGALVVATTMAFVGGDRGGRPSRSDTSTPSGADD